MNGKQMLEEIKRNYERKRRKERDFVRKEFETVCKEFFPRWKSKNEWKIKAELYLDSLGKCNHETKTILFRYAGFLRYDLKKLVSFYSQPARLTPKQAFQCLLVHEICHAVVRKGLGHGKEWRSRMLIAGKRASQFGRKRLAQHLYEESKMGRFLEKEEIKMEMLRKRLRRQKQI